MADIYVVKRLIDYIGLQARGVPEGTIPISMKMAPVLALLQGMAADGAKLLSVDANGNLAVTFAGQAATGTVQISDNLGNIFGGTVPNADALAAFRGLFTVNYPFLFNNATFDRIRSASAANLAAQSGLGAVLSALPGQWSINSAPGVSTQATITKAAGAAGVRHVCTGFGFGFSAAIAVVASGIGITLRDGASGAGTILKAWSFQLPAALIPNFAIEVAGCEIVGSPATAMTMEFTALLANLQEFVNLSGHDAS